MIKSGVNFIGMLIFFNLFIWKSFVDNIIIIEVDFDV